MSIKPNHRCKFCGIEYYACRGCDSSPNGHWKAVACTFEHFLSYTELVKQSRSGSLAKDDKVEIYKPDLIQDEDIDNLKSEEGNNIQKDVPDTEMIVKKRTRKSKVD